MGGAHETLHGLWRAPFGGVPLGSWLRFDWAVRWSAFADE
eukprot:SAG22_NODE_14948_length_361_cov_0.587786_1_plen_39_part_01